MNQVLLLLFLMLFVYSCNSQEIIIPLWEKTIPNYQADEETVDKSRGISWVTKVHTPSIEIYLPTPKNATGQAVLICPGGGYRGLAYDWEGVDIARWLNSKGIAGIVLKYRLPIDKGNVVQHASPLLDAKRALRMVRANAKDWNIQPNQIGVMGFSAGGHLASTLGTHFDYGLKDGDDIDTHSCRPDFMALVYPVISMSTDFIHQGSKDALLGENPDADLVKHFSNELQVSTNTPSTFLVHSSDDEAVPVDNSIAFYQACIEKAVPAELHVYPMGGHGFGLAIGQTYLQTWPDRLADWLQAQRTNDPKKEE